MAKAVVNPEAELSSRAGDVYLSLEQLGALGIFASLKKAPSFNKFPGTYVLRHYRAGDAICRQGETGGTAFYLLTPADVEALGKQVAADDKPTTAEGNDPLRRDCERILNADARAGSSRRRRGRRPDPARHGAAADRQGVAGGAETLDLALVQAIFARGCRWPSRAGIHRQRRPGGHRLCHEAGADVCRRSVRRDELPVAAAALGNGRRRGRVPRARVSAKHSRSNAEGPRVQEGDRKEISGARAGEPLATTVDFQLAQRRGICRDSQTS